MTLEIQCPKCEERYSCPQRHAGKTIPCPNCGGPIPVPSAKSKTLPKAKPLSEETQPKPKGPSPAEAWFIDTPGGRTVGPLAKSKLDQLVHKKDFSGCLIRNDEWPEGKPVEDVYPEIAAAQLGLSDEGSRSVSTEQPDDGTAIEVWFIDTPEGQTIGPITKPKLDKLIRKKDFSGCLIRRDDWAEGRPLEEIYPEVGGAELPQVTPARAEPTPVDHVEISTEPTAAEPATTEPAIEPGVAEEPADDSAAEPEAPAPKAKEKKPGSKKVAAMWGAWKRPKPAVMLAAGGGGVLVVIVLCLVVFAVRKRPAEKKKVDVNELSVKDGTCYLTRKVRLPQSAASLCNSLMETIYEIATTRPDVKRIEFQISMAGSTSGELLPMGKIGVELEQLIAARNHPNAEAYLKSESREIYEIEVKSLNQGHLLK